jgi:hypothetical protein
MIPCSVDIHGRLPFFFFSEKKWRISASAENGDGRDGRTGRTGGRTDWDQDCMREE